MKKTTLLLFLLLSIFTLTACGGATTSSDGSNADTTIPEGAVELGSDTYGYVYLTGEWEQTIAESEGLGMIRFLSSDQSIVDLGIDKQSSGTLTIDQLAESNRSFYVDSFQAEDIVIDENASFQNYDAILLTGRYLDDGVNLEFYVKVWHFTDENGQVRFVTAEAVEESIDAFSKAVEDTYSITKK